MTTADEAIELYGAEADTEIVDTGTARAGAENGELAIFDPAEYETPEVPSRKPRLMNPLSWLLVLLLTLGAGVYGGIWIQKREAPAVAAASGRTGGRLGAAAAAAAAAAAGGGGTAFGGAGGFGAGAGAGAGAGGGGTRGSVILVDKANNAIYIQDAQGNNIKVAIGPTTTMKVSKTTTDVSDYAVGASVVVQGTTDADGNITATAITEGTGRGGGTAAAAGGAGAAGAAAAPTSTTGG